MLKNIKNIIFDLGNVVIDINLNETYKELAKLSKDFSWEDGERLLKEKQIWANYEKGHYSDAEFLYFLPSVFLWRDLSFCK